MPNFTPTTFRQRALSFVGLPYILGAEFDSSFPSADKPRALDCSELTETLCRENGTPLGDLAAAQYDKTIAVTGEIRVGDLVFLRNNKARWNGIGHVAVITHDLGNGDWEIVEARGSKSGVVVTTLSYWRTRPAYTGVRRFPAFSLLPELAAPLSVVISTPEPTPSPAPSASGLPLLKVTSPKLMRSELIRKLQRFAIQNFGSYAHVLERAGGADGAYGDGTRKWVAEFQRRVGLDDDGVVGPNTWAQLIKHGFRP